MNIALRGKNVLALLILGLLALLVLTALLLASTSHLDLSHALAFGGRVSPSIMYGN